MFRFVTAYRDPAKDLAPLQNAVRMLVLLVVLFTVPFAEPHPAAGAEGAVVVAALATVAVTTAVWLLGRNRPRVVLGSLVVLGAAGGVLAGLAPISTAIAVGCVVCATAGVQLDIEFSAAILAETVTAFLLTGLLTSAAAETLIGYPLTFVGLWAFGLTRRGYLLRAKQAEQALVDARRMHAAETQTTALAERARIARDIHDVLAHSLAAVAVNLQAAEGLLSALPPDQPGLAKALECIGRAGVFTREGLADARRAILALRSDAAPLADQLSGLAEEYRADGDLVDFAVTGSPRPVPAEAALAAYRTAQEALTNARKHAPGEHVDMSLEFAPDSITVRIANPLPDPDATAPLAATGAGYGLTGLRERAALGGGTLSAGPADGRWLLCLRIPA